MAACEIPLAKQPFGSQVSVCRYQKSQRFPNRSVSQLASDRRILYSPRFAGLAEYVRHRLEVASTETFQPRILQVQRRVHGRSTLQNLPLSRCRNSLLRSCNKNSRVNVKWSFHHHLAFPGVADGCVRAPFWSAKSTTWPIRAPTHVSTTTNSKMLF